jgi:hypothetical protein
MRRAFLPALLFVATLAVACQRTSSETEGFKGLFGADDKTFDQWFPAVVQGGDGAKKVKNPRFLEGDAPNAVVDVQITLKTEDSLELFRLWSGMGDTELLAPNQDIGRAGFRGGAVFTLRMTRDQFERFSAKRDLYHQSRTAARERGETVVGEVRHVVAKGETLQDVCARHPTTVDAILRANPELRMRLPSEGREILVPIIAEVAEQRRKDEAAGKVVVPPPVPSEPPAVATPAE